MSAAGDTKKLLRDIERAGGVVRRGRKHHVVYVNGQRVTAIGRSGERGASGNAKASRRALRAAGLKL